MKAFSFFSSYDIIKAIKNEKEKEKEKRRIKMENNDRIIKFLAYEGKVSIVCAKTTALVEKARKLQDLSPVATAAFGRLLTAASIMASTLKNPEDEMTIQVNGNGPIGKMLVTANYFPKVKGYVQNPYVDLPLKNGKLDVGGAVGKDGFLNVTKDEGLKDPYVGTVPLVSGEIAEDITSYYAISQQTPSVVSLGVLVNQNGVKEAGGYLVNLMPDAQEEQIQILEENLKQVPPISKMLEENLSLSDIAKIVTKDEAVVVVEENILPVYECNCSKERIRTALISLGKEELEDMVASKINIETVCQFCKQKYSFTPQELEEMIKEIEK